MSVAKRITGSVAYNWSKPNMKSVSGSFMPGTNSFAEFPHLFDKMTMEKMSKGSSGASKGGKKKGATFVIDCSKPVEDNIMEIASLRSFCRSSIKVEERLELLVTP
ncbi:60S ribosomal protein L22 [Datura stramonium]|uniref:Large ribosomal subunit protein eL22 n=1 Tax=Datura stramonium TaxID=4076 RepID=A0ABS8T556_DATST|nr:60S ribosomal protein L22 [Datura stramonium]